MFLWNAHGVILVYNPEDKDQLADLQRFHEHFVQNSIIPKNNALILGHAKDPDYNKNFSPDFSNYYILLLIYIIVAFSATLI